MQVHPVPGVLPRGQRVSGPWRPVLIAGAVLMAVAAAIVRPPALAATAARDVLIYYANETADRAARSDNYGRVLSALQRSPSPRAPALLASISEDARMLRAAVERDGAILRNVASRLGFDLAIFTNELALDGAYLYQRRETGVAERRPLPAIPPASSVVLATSPLSRPEYFRAALVDVAARNQREPLRVVLVTNSHGSDTMALMPRVSADLSAPGAADEFLRLLSASDDVPSPDWAVLKGTDKLAFWRIIADVSAAHDVRFPLVFRAACASGPASWTELSAVPASVERLAHTAMGALKFLEIDYAALFAPGAAPLDPARLSSALAHQGIHVSTRWTLWFWVAIITADSIPKVLYFVPLAAWAAWYARPMLLPICRGARTRAGSR